MTSFYMESRVATLYRACAALLLAAIIFVLPATAADPTTTDKSNVTKIEPAVSPDSAAQLPTYPGQKPTYPGGPSEKAKLEGTIGALKLRFYGTLLLNISTTDSVQVGQDVPLWALPGNIPLGFPDGTTRRSGIVRDTVFTGRQTVMGFTFAPAKSSTNGWEPSGVVEFDFFGSRPSDGLQPQGRVFNQPRIRLAYFTLEKGMWKIVAGQDRMIVAPLDPVSLSHVAIPLGATAGNLWGWLPQVRLDVTQKYGETSVLYQFGVLRPLFGDPRLAALGELPTAGSAVDGALSGFGERANQPFYQSRIALSHPMAGSTATFGFGGHFGRERIGASRTLDSWTFAFDVNAPLHSRVIFRGEGFVGSNLAPFQGGIEQGVAIFQPVATAPPRKISRIGAGGGWAELTFRATEDDKNIFYVGAGTDDPRDRDLLPGSTRSKNSFLWASYFRKLTTDVTLAVEWSFWDFRTRALSATTGALGVRQTSGRGNVINIALAYQF